jgi:hypothetical protein
MIPLIQPRTFKEISTKIPGLLWGRGEYEAHYKNQVFHPQAATPIYGNILRPSANVHLLYFA